MKKMIDVHYPLSHGITDNNTLREIKDTVNNLIERYGESAKIDFDSGYSNISETVIYKREETDGEWLNRLEAENKSRSKKENAEYATYLKMREKFENIKSVKEN